MATARQRKAAEAKATAKYRDLSNRYDAAGQGRRIKSWNAPSTGPSRVIHGTEKLRNRALDSVRNDWGAGSATQKWETALIGVGVTPRWEADDLNTSWALFVKQADADCVLNAYAMQGLAVREWWASGEVFLRRRPRSLLTPLNAPVQVQIIGSEYCPMFDTKSWTGLPEGNEIRQGIEVNKYGRRVAFWFYKDHPHDRIGQTPGLFDLIRVPASEVSHVFEPKRAGQMRGVSEMANVLVRLRSSADFEDAVLDRQKIANLFAAFVKRPAPPEEDVDFDPLTGLPAYYDAKSNPLAGLEPGIFQELGPGEDIVFSNPPEAGTTFSEYMRTNGLGTAAGAGLPYELMTGDIANVSDRTLRVVINEFRRFAESRQWHLVIPMICQPMVDWWAEAMVLAGNIPMSRLAEAKAPEHAPHGWEYIHPVQDVQGKVAAIEAGLTSQSAEISKKGDDPKKVFAQRAADVKLSEKLGLPAPPAPKVAAPAQADPQGDPKADPKADPAQARFEAFMAAQQATNAAILAVLAALKPPEAPCPT